jgi:hypothetical protein
VRQGERSTARVEEDKDGTRRKTGRTAVGYFRIFRFSFLSFFKGKSQIFWITIFSDVYWIDTLYGYTFHSPNYEMEKIRGLTVLALIICSENFICRVEINLPGIKIVRVGRASEFVFAYSMDFNWAHDSQAFRTIMF